MSPPGCQKMSAKPCNRNAEESFPVLSLKSREQKPPNSLLIQDKNVLQPSADLHRTESGGVEEPGKRLGLANPDPLPRQLRIERVHPGVEGARCGPEVAHELHLSRVVP